MAEAGREYVHGVVQYVHVVATSVTKQLGDDLSLYISHSINLNKNKIGTLQINARCSQKLPSLFLLNRALHG